MIRRQLISIFLLLTATTACDRYSSASRPERNEKEVEDTLKSGAHKRIQMAKEAVGLNTTKKTEPIKRPQMEEIMREHRAEIEARLTKKINCIAEELRTKLRQRCEKDNITQKELRKRLKFFCFGIANFPLWHKLYKKSTREEFRVLANLLMEYAVRRYNLRLVKEDVDFSLIENKESKKGHCSMCSKETTVFDNCVAENEKCVSKICIKCYCERQWIGTGVAWACDRLGLYIFETPNYRCPHCKELNRSSYFQRHIAKAYSDPKLKKIYKRYEFPFDGENSTLILKEHSDPKKDM